MSYLLMPNKFLVLESTSAFYAALSFPTAEELELDDELDDEDELELELDPLS